jgi:hypothetical protein
VNRAQRRSLLEAVATSQDPSLSASERLRAIELLEKIPDEPETPRQAISTTVAEMRPEALDFELDGMLANVVHAGDLDARFPELSSALEAEVQRRVELRKVRVHVPPEPEPELPPVKVHAEQMTLADAAPLATTYSAEYYERLGVPVAAELDR